MFSRLVSLLVLFLLSFSFRAQAAQSATFWKVDGCVLTPDRWNDGDSFHALIPKGTPVTANGAAEFVIRLYFVDTVEGEAKYGERIEAQAVYFGISNEQAHDLAKAATEFTKQKLAKPFRLWTRGRAAMGLSALGRIYSFVVTADGEDLNAALVANGLARIHGTSTIIPNGKTSAEYIAQLHELETKAKAAKKGGWGYAQAEPKPATPAVAPKTATPAVQTEGGYFASRSGKVFHKPNCKSVPTISAENLVKFGTREEATAAGKKPCAICNP